MGASDQGRGARRKRRAGGATKASRRRALAVMVAASFFLAFPVAVAAEPLSDAPPATPAQVELQVTMVPGSMSSPSEQPLRPAAQVRQIVNTILHGARSDAAGLSVAEAPQAGADPPAAETAGAGGQAVLEPPREPPAVPAAQDDGVALTRSQDHVPSVRPPSPQPRGSAVWSEGGAAAHRPSGGSSQATSRALAQPRPPARAVVAAPAAPHVGSSTSKIPIDPAPAPPPPSRSSSAAVGPSAGTLFGSVVAALIGLMLYVTFRAPTGRAVPPSARLVPAPFLSPLERPG